MTWFIVPLDTLKRLMISPSPTHGIYREPRSQGVHLHDNKIQKAFRSRWIQVDI